MRILLTTDTIGGVWTFTEELARGLLLARHEVALVSFGKLPSPAQAAAMHQLSAQGLIYVASKAPLEWMEANERTWVEGRADLDRVVQGFQPDVIHSGQFCFGRLSGEVPVVITAHSDVLSWAQGVLGGVAELERTCAPDWLTRYRALVADGLAGAAAVVAPTRWMAEEVARLYSLDLVPQVIANGVSLPQTDSVPRKLQAVTAGRLWDQAKGLAVLKESDSPWPVLVAGEGEIDEAEWLGALPHEQLLQLFRESALYLATSLYEPFGLAPLEAALCGCAVVARDLPSFREVWEDAALYFNSPGSLRNLLASFVEHPRRLKGAQCRAKQRAAGFSAEAMTAHYVALYQELVEPVSQSPERVFANA